MTEEQARNRAGFVNAQRMAGFNLACANFLQQIEQDVSYNVDPIRDLSNGSLRRPVLRIAVQENPQDANSWQDLDSPTQFAAVAFFSYVTLPDGSYAITWPGPKHVASGNIFGR